MRRAIEKLAALPVAALVFALAVPAGAVPPEKNDLFFALDDADCGGGLTYDIELNGQEIVHDNGDEVMINVNIAGEAVASDGTVIRVHHSWTETVDFAAGTITVTGIGFGSWVQGGTAKVLDRGRLVFDLAAGEAVFMAGHWTENFDPHALTCELIASA